VTLVLTGLVYFSGMLSNLGDSEESEDDKIEEENNEIVDRIEKVELLSDKNTDNPVEIEVARSSCLENSDEITVEVLEEATVLAPISQPQPNHHLPPEGTIVYNQKFTCVTIRHHKNTFVYHSPPTFCSNHRQWIL
jgi:hypothetical protein